ncbi:hypothetical protein GGG16DRAFT_96914 [Schizophyllum commune]
MPRTFTLPDGRQFTSKIEIPQKFSDALNIYRSLHDHNPVVAETALWTNLLALFQDHLSAQGTPTNAALETQYKAGRIAGAEAERGTWESEGHARAAEYGRCRDYDVGYCAGYDAGHRSGKALGVQTCGVLWNVMRARVLVPCADPPHVDVASARVESAVQTSPHEEPSTTSGISLNSVDWASDADAHLPVIPPPPRDLSCLSSGTSRPFASLNRRRRGAQSRSRPRRRHAGAASRRWPESRLPQIGGTLLDWVHDPRLQDLTRALHALGWVRSSLTSGSYWSGFAGDEGVATREGGTWNRDTGT